MEIAKNSQELKCLPGAIDVFRALGPVARADMDYLLANPKLPFETRTAVKKLLDELDGKLP